VRFPDSSNLPAVAQVFISYARDDDEPPPDDPNATGFVSYLHNQLRYELTQLGPPAPVLWRDQKTIERGHRFEPRLVEALAQSTLLLVVLSRNWMERGWCRRELDEFVKQRGADAHERIVIVGKNGVPPERLPEELRGQEGYNLFGLDRENGEEVDFFVRSNIVDNRYRDRVRGLARYLWRSACELTSRSLGPDLALHEPPGPPYAPPADPAPAITAASTGRRVFLAKPARDMEQTYDMLAHELAIRGYDVVPAPTTDLPDDGAEAVMLIDDALAEAEMSIHLLGRKPGFAPDGEQPIVSLQLARAARRVGQAVSDAAHDPRRFHRIIWAPRTLPEHAIVDRSPAAALASFGDCLEGDQLMADPPVSLRQFVIQHLEANTPRPAPTVLPPADGAKIYVRYAEADEAFGDHIAEALSQVGHEAWIPAFDGEEMDRNKLHQNYLADCDAVVLCWANASEAWVRSNAAELRWEKLQRKAAFHCRGVVAGPPPLPYKNRFQRLRPRTSVDLVIDATSAELSAEEALQPLLQTLAGNGS
jgi:hypothetical protein